MIPILDLCFLDHLLLQIRLIYKLLYNSMYLLSQIFRTFCTVSCWFFLAAYKGDYSLLGHLLWDKDIPPTLFQTGWNNSLFSHKVKNMRFDRTSTTPQSKPVLSKCDRRLSNLEFIQQTIDNKPLSVSYFDKYIERSLY